MRKGLVMYVIIASIILALTVPNCSNGKNIESQNVFITKQQAIELATNRLREKGWDPSRYIMTIKEEKDQWIIIFEGKKPRPPGDGVDIYVSKSDGTIIFRQGE